MNEIIKSKFSKCNAQVRNDSKFDTISGSDVCIMRQWIIELVNFNDFLFVAADAD